MRAAEWVFWLLLMLIFPSISLIYDVKVGHFLIDLAIPICKQMQLVIYCNQDKYNHQMLDADICINQDQRPRFPDEFIKELDI